jgi:hypothetical protein
LQELEPLPALVLAEVDVNQQRVHR